MLFLVANSLWIMTVSQNKSPLLHHLDMNCSLQIYLHSYSVWLSVLLTAVWGQCASLLFINISHDIRCCDRTEILTLI